MFDVYGLILRTRGLRQLQCLVLENCIHSDAHIKGLFEGIDSRALPSLLTLNLSGNHFTPTGVEILAAALRAVPKLQLLNLGRSELGDQDVAALALPMRTHPALRGLFLSRTGLSDEGMASLLADLKIDEFKRLKVLDLDFNGKLTDKGCETLLMAIKARALPALGCVDFKCASVSRGAKVALAEELFASPDDWDMHEGLMTRTRIEHRDLCCHCRAAVRAQT